MRLESDATSGVVLMLEKIVAAEGPAG
jgi:hypothetical protein